MPTRCVLIVEQTGAGSLSFVPDRDVVLKDVTFLGGGAFLSMSAADDGTEIGLNSVVIDRFYLKSDFGWQFLNMNIPVPSGSPVWFHNFSAGGSSVQLMFDEVFS